MSNFILRKHIRKILNEYGNFASALSSPYGSTEFPDSDIPTTPTEIDHLNDLKFADEYSEGGENEDDMQDEMGTEDTDDAVLD